MKNSELELRPTDINGSEPKRNGNSEPNNQPKSLLGKIRAAIAFLTIEPFLLCYILPNSISSIAVQRLNLEKACRVDLGHTKEKCDEWDGNITIQIQSMVADMTTWQVPLTSAIPAIVILFVGAWSDSTGIRKALMLIPIFGELVSAFGLVLTTHYFEEWPLFVTALIEALPTALSGGFSIALMGSYSYLADVTSVESRTFRIGIAAVIVTLGAPAAISISGVLLDAIGYYGIFGLTTTLYAFGLLYTFFRIHDVNPKKTEGTWYQKLINFFHPKNAWDTLYIVFKDGPNRTKILLVLLAHVVIIGPVFGEGAMLYQYLLFKYSMDDVEISLFFTFSILIGLCGTAVAVTLFSKFMKMHDAILGVIATTCKVISSIVYALAPTRPWFYSGPFFDFFGGTGVTAIRSLGTKVVAPEEVAKMCSLIGLMEAITPVIYTPMYSQMYKATIETLPGAFYLLGGAMTVPAFFIFITLYVIYKKEERDKVKNPESKERYAHENDVTAF
ncbi:proton-coupled folate transporter-like [Leguminivora glycinivorella]|uniref:proton-coupled folate transporter-like n=1 Tax=Leguminivora glycinivorella TaxID=1035111 RepID=UPI00200C2667|nr:proton-coupled folate transporter-like [Leguminivora glycinivorella]